eukprot:CAMPEP_0175961974 /NCGR_PEP_ID=MMETSP0108-20121206/36224_1 /TAXON_ID=195067 ORGANISM="Goniomonas pacifica, Strain CCMP1869" /NCGR_SAMPLE_ID=MMETSP0108 /ASSEMBLY_ACC=CAM_ASM_000204 /LENGTH=131 /DNA_ID=CAMNT_0017289745 /DNA_START=158 /DNA_END=553 /DNA_ORIENTATION=+
MWLLDLGVLCRCGRSCLPPDVIQGRASEVFETPLFAPNRLRSTESPSVNHNLEFLFVDGGIDQYLGEEHGGARGEDDVGGGVDPGRGKEREGVDGRRRDLVDGGAKAEGTGPMHISRHEKDGYWLRFERVQ